jgi:hypothetical protein
MKRSRTRIRAYENLSNVTPGVAIRADVDIGLATLGILLDIIYAFCRVKNVSRYGGSRIIAMLHLVVWERKEWRTWIQRYTSQA